MKNDLYDYVLYFTCSCILIFSFLSGSISIAEVPENFDSLIQKGKTEFFNGKIDDSLKIFEQCISIVPDHSLGYLWHGIALTAKQDIEEAKKDFLNAQKLHPTLPEVYAELGMLEFIPSQECHIPEHIETALKLDPKNCRALTYKSHILTFYQKDFDAVPLLNQIINNHSQTNCSCIWDSKRCLAHAYFELSHIYFSQKKLDEALEKINVAIQHDVSQALYYEFRATIYMSINMEKSLRDINTAIDLRKHPTPTCILLKGKILMDLGRTVEASKYLETFVTNTNEFSQICALYVNCLIILEQYQKTLDYLNKFSNTSQQPEIFFYWRGRSYFYLKKWDQAYSDISKFIERNPVDRESHVLCALAALHLKKEKVALENLNNYFDFHCCECYKNNPEFKNVESDDELGEVQEMK
jgi:tetratricopeptide (TPR) repeat protein